MSNIIGDLKVLLGLDPTQAVKGMHTAETSVRKGTKKINTDLQSVKKFAIAAFSGWQIKQLATDFAKSAMEMDSMRKSMAAAVGGAEKGRREINYLRKESQKMGLSFKDSTKDFKMLAAAAKGTALEGEGIRKVWKSLQNATVALQLTTAETSGTVYAFKDMLSKGTVQSEELKRQLGNRLPGAFRMAAEAMGLTTNELAKQMKLGKIMAEDFLPALARELNKTYGKAAVEASKAMRAELNRAKSAWFDFQAAFMEETGATTALAKTLSIMTKSITTFTNALKGDTSLDEWFINQGANIKILWEKFNGFINNVQQKAKLKKLFSLEEIGALDELDSVAFWKRFDAKIKAYFSMMITVIKANKKELKKVLKSLSPVALLHSKLFPSEAGTQQKKAKDEMIKMLKERKNLLRAELKAIEAEAQAAIKAAGLSDVKKAKDKIYDDTDKEVKRRIAKIKADRDGLKAALISADPTKDMPEAGSVIFGEKNALKTSLTELQTLATNLSKSFAKMGEEAGDVAKNISDAFTSAFNAMSDALSQMIIKGKVDWRSLADAMISDMVRIAVRQAVIAPLMMAFSQGMSTLSQPAQWGGTGVASASTTNASGSMSSSWATYNTAPKKHAAQSLSSNQVQAAPKKGVAVNVQPVINISTPPGTQSTTQQSSDGMNIDVLVTAVESKLSSNIRRGSGLSDTMQQTFGLNRASGAFR